MLQFDLPLMVYMDASDMTIGAILSDVTKLIYLFAALLSNWTLLKCDGAFISMKCMLLFMLWARSNATWSIAIHLCILIISFFSTLYHSLSWPPKNNISLILLPILIWMSSVSPAKPIFCFMYFLTLQYYVALRTLPPQFIGNSFFHNTRTHLACLGALGPKI